MSAEVLRDGEVARFIRDRRLVVVLRRLTPQDVLLRLVDELADAGARIFEVTFDGASAAADLAALRRQLAARGGGPFLVGAGTITDAGRLEQAIAAGAAFGVAPALDVTLVRAAVGAGLPFFPGAFTPTEVAAGWSAGATMVKLFPASAAGPSFVRELRGPMPEVPIIATGGVDGSNATAFLAAGAAAVGMGGALVRASPDERHRLVDAITGSAP